MSTIDLQPSKLGTKEHWDDVYEQELANFEEIGDEGEIWFGQETVEKMVEWSLDNVPPSTNPSILEVGSGNGTLLFALVDAGYNPRSTSGIDYSAGAVQLAKNVAETRGTSAITFNQCDFLTENPPPLLSHDGGSGSELWDLVLDKGTYDAIALAEKDDDDKSPATKYPSRVVKLLKPGGYFLITSCNFTEHELKASFVTDEAGFIYHSRINYPTFTFGGHSGSSVFSVAFQKLRAS